MPVVRLLAAVALLLAIAPAARAAEVARDGDVSVHAVERRGELCLTVYEGAERYDEACAAPPYSAFRFLAASVPEDRFAMAVAPRVAEVDVGGVRYPTVAAEGFDLRFAIGRNAAAPFVRMYDGAGAAIGAVEIGLNE